MEIGVFAFIKNSEGKILLVRDATRQQKWTLPGGGLEFQEIITDGVIREVKEETGVDVKVKGLAGIFSQKKTPGIVALFDCEIISGVPVINDKNEVGDIKYFSLEELTAIQDTVKPAQFSMVQQKFRANNLPIFNTF